MIEILLKFIFDIFGGYILADFIMGIYHWFKDSYFGPLTPIIGKKFIWGSRLHHLRPRFVTEFSNMDLFKSSAMWTMIWMAPLILILEFSPFILSLFLTISLNDVIHKYAHLKDIERPQIVTIMQKLYILQSYEEHHIHHTYPHDTNYCPITPYVNFILEYVNFWRRLEAVVEKYIGVIARDNCDTFVEDLGYAGGVRFV